MFNGTIYNYRELRTELIAMGNAFFVDTQLDPIALHHHFTLHTVVPAPRTVLRGVRKLPPATTMSVRALDRHRLAADVPVGELLSGGLDSSLLVGLLADQVDDLRTFSIGFEGIEGISVGAEKADEFEFSDLIAAQFKTRHQKFLIPNSEVLARLPEAVAAMTEPMMSHDVIAFYLLSERVSKEVKVVLAGQGADEVFGGYFWYPVMWRQVPAQGDPARCDPGRSDRPAEGLLPGARLETCARSISETDARHPAIRRLRPARPLPENVRRQAIGRSDGPLHAHSGQQVVAPGAAGMVAAGACGRGNGWRRRCQRLTGESDRPHHPP